jgi:predicted DNA-binding transcriptional regulator AlpA
MGRPPIRRRLRYRDLIALGIVNNRRTLLNWIRDRGFPPGQLTGPNSRTWGEDEVQAWLDSRPTAPKKGPVVKRRRGRPRKTRPTSHEVTAP